VTVISRATTSTQLDDVRSLIRAFLSWHRERQDEAMRLYERSGFRRIAPYYPLSDDLKAWLAFFELEL